LRCSGSVACCRRRRPAAVWVADDRYRPGSGIGFRDEARAGEQAIDGFQRRKVSFHFVSADAGGRLRGKHDFQARLFREALEGSGGAVGWKIEGDDRRVRRRQRAARKSQASCKSDDSQKKMRDKRQKGTRMR